MYQGGAVVGYCDMIQGSIGLQLGGQDYSEILVFRTRDALNTFKNRYAKGAQRHGRCREKTGKRMAKVN